MKSKKYAAALHPYSNGLEWEQYPANGVLSYRLYFVVPGLAAAYGRKIHQVLCKLSNYAEMFGDESQLFYWDEE